MNNTDEDKSWKVRAAEVRSLESAGGEKALAGMLPFLRDKTWQVRRSVVESLGNLKDPGSFSVLMGCLEDEFWQVRQAAAFALGYLSSEFMKTSPSEYLHDPGVVLAGEKLIDRLKNDTDWHARQAIAFALRHFDREMSGAPLIDALKDPDWHIQCTAAESLGELGEVMALKPIENMMSAADPMARRIFRIAVEKIRK
ncbi:MAG: HEAT repeat domain-containing protein [Candidatus Eremiobacteraeota bacterium]|nr:HEAT repeat domain-containing protein [Candidatus Eremiobacteraeota bacterium]